MLDWCNSALLAALAVGGPIALALIPAQNGKAPCFLVTLGKLGLAAHLDHARAAVGIRCRADDGCVPVLLITACACDLAHDGHMQRFHDRAGRWFDRRCNFRH